MGSSQLKYSLGPSLQLEFKFRAEGVFLFIFVVCFVLGSSPCPISCIKKRPDDRWFQSNRCQS